MPDDNIVKAPYFKGKICIKLKLYVYIKYLFILIGLDYSEIGNENNFLHINLQYHLHKGIKHKVRSDYNGSIDFLESIKKDIPKGKLLISLKTNLLFLIYYY